MRRLEQEQLEDFLHRDLGAKLIEVDTRHEASFLHHGELVEAGSFRSLFYIGERGTILFEVTLRSIRRVASQRLCD